MRCMGDSSAETVDWIRRFHPAPDAELQLFCFPHAGGSANTYFSLSRRLAPAIQTAALQYPGRMDRLREPLVDDLLRLADLTAKALLPLTTRPFALFGHSMGATLAFETARRLRTHGASPVALVVSGRRSPTRQYPEYHHQATDEELLAELNRLSGTSPEILRDQELMRMLLPVIRNDYKAIETYRYEPGPPLTVPITAHVGTEDPKASVEDVRAWSELTTGPFTLHTHPGGHFYLTEREAELAADLARLTTLTANGH